ncbi:Uma2 family endonuclease [Methylicorpusculum oleiharenae]|uniref:Uma2 family endonuclease n=1 Tax=Methylicorpusculum oleiharenae TaxID=1338687 RepID=UPI00135893CE|nr:Uma2 family endonuclease [Methylicorpusculum oleiharenae]MCD2452496.1 Uma2 family endonuclease [Methylicorpusculum oleiharenae]
MVANLNNAINQNSYIRPVVLHWPPSMRLVNDQFFEFCQANKELRIERNAHGDCEIMAPTGGVTGWRNSGLTAQLYNWAESEGSGVVFDSSCGFVLPNGAIRSPDVSWVKKSRLATLTPEQKQGFLPLCPDFVIELRSPSDNLKTLQDKMQEFMENGASLGWLIDTEARQVLVFKPQKRIFRLEKPEFLSADEVLKGLELAMKKIWDFEF